MKLKRSSIQLKLYQGFQNKLNHTEKIEKFVKKTKIKWKKIACVGAPAKGMTLLNYNKLNNDIIEFVTEVSKLKLNKYCPGTDLKILHDNKLIANDIDYALILPGILKKEIMKNLKNSKNLVDAL